MIYYSIFKWKRVKFNMKEFSKIVIILYIIMGSLIFSNDGINKKILKNNITYMGNEKTPFTGKIIDDNIYEEYKDGIKHGLFKGMFSEEGEIYLYEGRYLNGIKHGIWKIMYQDGKIKGELEYSHDKPCGQWKYYYRNKVFEGYENFEDGILSGRLEYFDKTGNVSTDALYYKGLLSGKFVKYYSADSIDVIANFHYGKLNGTIKFFSKDGILLLEGKYFQNKRVDLWRLFYNNGNIKTTISYKNGKKNGEMIIYDKNGMEMEKIIFQDGKEVGNEKASDEFGQNKKDKIITKLKKITGELKYEKYNKILSNL